MTGEPAADLTFRGGTLFGWLEGGLKDLATIDKTLGVATVVGDSGLTITRGSGLAAAADGTLYYTGSDDDGLLRTIDPVTGAPTDGPTLDGTCGAPIRALAFDASGTLYGVRRSGGTCSTTQLITIDTATGHVAVVGDTLSDLDGIAFDNFTPPPPPPPPPPPDTDGDGLPDASDACPTTFAQTPNGCPAAFPSPVIGELVVTEVVSGRVTIALPGGSGFIPLSDAQEIPVGSVIDARHGTVRLTSARDSAGRTQTGDFSGGIFKLRQSRKRSERGLTDLVLRGGSFKGCGAARGRARQRLAQPARRPPPARQRPRPLPHQRPEQLGNGARHPLGDDRPLRRHPHPRSPRIRRGARLPQEEERRPESRQELPRPGTRASPVADSTHRAERGKTRAGSEPVSSRHSLPQHAA